MGAASLFIIARFAYVYANVPDELNFQGKLTDANGVNVANGTYNFQVRIYDDPTADNGANLVYTQTLNTVQVTNGIFNLKFSPSGANLTGGDRYLQVCFDSNGTGSDAVTGCGTTATSTGDTAFDKRFLPRKLLTSNPYSLISKFLGSNYIYGGDGAEAGSLNFQGATGVGTSLSGEGKIYFDGTKFKCSENGAAYVDCINTAAGGVTTMGALDGQSKTATGATISGTTLYLQSADGSNPGLVTAGTQTFGGSKTFTSAPTVSTFTQGSLVFAGTGGLLSQNNANLFWDDSNARLGIGTATPYTQLVVPGKLPTSTAGTLASAAFGRKINIQGNYAYIGADTNKFVILDISNPASPVTVSTTTTTAGNPMNIVPSGKYAYVLYQTTKLIDIYDISNPSSPTLVGTIGSNGGTDISINGRYAFITGTTAGVTAVDISNPAAPVVVGTLAMSNSATIFVQGSYAYIGTDSVNFIRVVDISNPAAMTLTGSLAMTRPNGVYVQDKYLYVVSLTGNTLNVVDISNPASPSLVGSVSTGASSNPVYVYAQGRYVYVYKAGNGNIQIIDVSDPASPVSVGNIATGGTNGHMTVKGRFIFSNEYSTGTVRVYDMGGSYIQQFESGGLEAGTLAIKTNGVIGNSLDIRGSLNIGNGGLYSAGNLGTAGGVELTTAFEIRGNSAPSVSLSNSGKMYFDSGSNKFRCSENTGSYFDCFSGSSPISGSATAGQVTFWDGTNSITGNNNLFWDNGNARLGIGISSPASELHISGVSPVTTFTSTNGVSGSRFNVLGLTGENSIAYRFQADGTTYFTLFKPVTSTDARLAIGTSAGAYTIDAIVPDEPTPSLRIGQSTTSNVLLQVGSTEYATLTPGYSGATGTFDINPVLNGNSTGTVNIRLFRTTNTSGASALQIYQANNTASVNSSLSANSSSYLNAVTGNVGIGTSAANANAKLDVQGVLEINLENTASTTALCHSVNGQGASNTRVRDCTGTPAADYMEFYSVEMGISKGDIVSATSAFVTTEDGERIAKLDKAVQLTSAKIIGIVSDEAKAGDFNSIGRNIKTSDNPQPVALSGRVPVKIDSSSDPISVGDLITISSNPGKGKKLNESGFVIGKALENWSTGQETVMVIVQNYYHATNTSSYFKLDASNNLTSNSSLVINGNIQAESLSIGANKLTIDTNGNLNTLGNISAKNLTATSMLTATQAVIKNLKVDKLSINQNTTGDATIGTSKILTGQNKVTINNSNISANAKVFTTLRSNTNQTLAVTNIIPSTSFDVEIPVATSTDISFDYWIILE